MTEPTPRGGFIGRQVALGFGAVSAVAVIMGAMLLGVIYDVSDLVEGMRHDETSIQQGLQLATAVRALSIHTHSALLDPDGPHLSRYAESRDHVAASVGALRGRVPEAERWRLEALTADAAEMDQRFKQARAVMQAGDTARGIEARAALSALGERIAVHGDALARAAGSQMAHAHVQATDSAALGRLIAALCIALALAISVGFTLRLRAAVLRPLLALTEGARQLGQGDFSRRVGAVGPGELGALAGAFDHMADELARREARLLRSERMAAIGQLAAGVAHELNNPIGIIRGYLKTMDPEGDVETLREELGILDEEAAQCARIAHDLLAYARADELSLDMVDMARLLSDTATRFAESADAEGHPIEVHADAAQITADGPRLRQVILNLLANAAQVSPEGAPICVRGHLEGGRYMIEIEDQGPGVAPEDRDRVFEPFFTTRRNGTGLGLSVCLGIIQAHHGQIEICAGALGGALFRVSLPRPEEPTHG